MIRRSLPKMASRTKRPFFQIAKLNSRRNQASALATPALDPASISGTSVARMTVLDNGLRVASCDLQLPTMTVGLWCDCGSRYETDDNNGVAHYFEHLVFKGRVNEAKYMVKLLSNIVQKPTLSDLAIDRERSVIVREMEDIAQNQEETIYDYLHEIAFRGTPLGFTILGPEKIVKTIKRHSIADFVKKHYVPQRMVLAAAGGISHEDLCELGKQYFRKTDAAVPEAVGTKFQTGLKYQVVNQMPSLHIAMACPSAEWTSPDTLPLMLASQLIGQYQRGAVPTYTTRLVLELDKKNMVQEFKAFNTIYNDIGLWGFYVVVDEPQKYPDRAKEVISTILNEVKHMSKPGNLDTEIVERAKKSLLAQTAIQLDGTENVCEDIGRQILCYGRRIEWPEWEWRINDITVDDIQKALGHYVDSTNFAYSAIGPNCDLGIDEANLSLIDRC